MTYKGNNRWVAFFTRFDSTIASSLSLGALGLKRSWSPEPLSQFHMEFPCGVWWRDASMVPFLFFVRKRKHQVLEIHGHTSRWRAENRTGKEHILLRTSPWGDVFSGENQSIARSTEISEMAQLHPLVMKKNNWAQRGGDLVSSHSRWGVLAGVYLS